MQVIHVIRRALHSSFYIALASRDSLHVGKGWYIAFPICPPSVFVISKFDMLKTSSLQCCDILVSYKSANQHWVAVSHSVVNSFLHINALWCLCSRRLFEKIVTKYFPLLVIGYPFNYRDFLFFDKICSKSSAAELSYEEKGCLDCMTMKSQWWHGRSIWLLIHQLVK